MSFKNETLEMILERLEKMSMDKRLNVPPHIARHYRLLLRCTANHWI